MAIKILDKGKLVRNLAVNHKLVPHLEKVVGEGDFSWKFDYEPKQGDDAFHPSGDCTTPLFDLWVGANAVMREKAGGPANPPRQFPAALYKTFMVGHFWHQYLQYIVQAKLGFCDEDAIERRGHKWWGEVQPVLTDGPCWDDTSLYVPAWPDKPGQRRYGRPAPYHWATGSADIAPCSIPSHGDYIIDFKTMNAMDFRKQAGPGWAVPKWECQLNVYMDFFDLDRAIIVGICKDSPHDFREFEFHRNQALIDAIYLKWQLVSECLDEDIIPPEDEDIELPLKGPLDK